MKATRVRLCPYRSSHCNIFIIVFASFELLECGHFGRSHDLLDVTSLIPARRYVLVMKHLLLEH